MGPCLSRASRHAGSAAHGSASVGIAAAVGGDEVHVVVSTLVGAELCSLRCRRDSTWREFIAALEAALGKRLEAGHVLVQGTDALGGRLGGELCPRQPFLQAPEDEEAVQLTLLLGQPPAVRKALDWLAEADADSRVEALRALFESGAQASDPEVVDALEPCFRDQSWMTRCEALQTFAVAAEKGDQRMIGAVSACLRDEIWSVRRTAARALGKISERGDQHAVDALVALLEDRNATVLSSACEALAHIAVKGDQRIVQALAALLEDPLSYPSVRGSACRALGQLAEKGDRRVISMVIPLLQERDATVLRSACEVFEHIAVRGDQRVIQALTALLGEPQSYFDVRGSACRALGQVAEKGDRGVVEQVAALLEDHNSAVLRNACEALAHIAVRGDRRIVQALTAARLLHSDSRGDACLALGQLAERGDRRVVEALTPLLEDPLDFVRRSAGETLATLQDGV